jgi:hypothetical protein
MGSYSIHKVYPCVYTGNGLTTLQFTPYTSPPHHLTTSPFRHFAISPFCHFVILPCFFALEKRTQAHV